MPELVVGFYKTGSGKGGLTYREALDEALCAGWIDGVRRSVDAASYSIRFTPRKSRSTWSAVNIRRAEELSRLGLMQAPGQAAFAERDVQRAKLYSYERETGSLEPAQEKRFQANARAWKFFSAQPPYYRRTATWWVISAKREETRERRLATLIADSAQGRKIAPLDISSSRKKI
jgi:uncharacterized protein YdeI (YjbR/CyaY-like superfamily)